MYDSLGACKDVFGLLFENSYDRINKFHPKALVDGKERNGTNKAGQGTKKALLHIVKNGLQKQRCMRWGVL